MTAEKCPFKDGMKRLAAALNQCQGFTLKQRRDAMEGVKKAICGPHCATICKHHMEELTEGQRWLLR